MRDIAGRRGEGVVRYLAISYLRGAREFLSNREISEIVGLPEPAVSRYTSGRVLPSYKCANEILERLRKSSVLEKILKSLLEVDEGGVVNVPKIAFDAAVLKMASVEAFFRFRDLDVDVVMTAAVNGVPLATLVSDVLGARLCVAKREVDAGGEYIGVEIPYPPPQPRRVSFYAPKYSLKASDRVLVVDDLLYSGRTLKALSKLAEIVGSEIVGVYALIGVGSEWKRAIPESAYRIVVLLEVPRSL